MKYTTQTDWPWLGKNMQKHTQNTLK